MRIRIVDAFTDRPFSGNPAGVLLLESDGFPPAERLQEIAAEVNLSETAFAHPLPPGGAADWALRWFTPVVEVDMCGHATLATAHVLHTTGRATGPVRFPRCGVLTATRARTAASRWTSPPPRWPRSRCRTVSRTPSARTPSRCTTPASTSATCSSSCATRRPYGGSPRTARRWWPTPGAGHRHRGRRGPRPGLRLRLALLLPGRRHRRGPGHRQRPHRAGPLLVGPPRPRRPHRPPGIRPLGPGPYRSARRAHPADRYGGHGDRRRTAHRALTASDAGPAPIRRAQGVGSQSTRPASSAYPTNAPMSRSACATTSGPTRPQRR